MYQTNVLRTILISGFMFGSHILCVPTALKAAEIEPNNTIESASAFVFGEQGNEGQWSGETTRDEDFYKLETEQNSLYDLYIETDDKAVFDVSLLDSNGKEQFKSRNTGFYKLTRLHIPVGTSYLKVSAYLKDKTEYRIYLETPRLPKSGYEFEPNDAPENGTFFPENNIIKGRLDSADTDYLIFDSDEALSMWRLDANGVDLSTITYMNDASHKLSMARPASQVITNMALSDLLLSKGRHYFEVKGKGDYRLSLRRIGNAPSEVLSIDEKPDFSTPSPELEPNNEPGMALPLHAGQTRRGTIGFVNDVDYYRFSLEQPSKVTLTLNAAENDGLNANLNWGLNQKTRIGKITLQPNETKGFFEQELLQGDYLLDVKSTNFSDNPYQINLKIVTSPKIEGASTNLSAVEGLMNIKRERNDIKADNAPKLIDGSAAGSASANLKIGTAYDIEFSDAPATLGGIILDTHHERAPGFTLKRFKLEAQSEDGTFKPLMEQEIPVIQDEYAFKFDHPVTTQSIRITPLEAGFKSYQDVVVGELKPLLSVDTNHANDVDLFTLENGGHIIFGSYFLDAASVLTEDNRTAFVQIPKNYKEKPYWVTGFETSRAPLLKKLKWQDLKKNQNDLLNNVEVFSNLSTPSGPWTSIGTFKRNEKGEMPDIEFEKPLWARYLKFVVNSESNRRFVLPEKIFAYEAPATENYQSIIAEWGNGNKSSSYERLHKITAAQDLKPTRKKNQPLQSSTEENGVVLRNKAEDHYILTVPQGMKYLKLSLKNPHMLSVEPVLKTKTGEILDFSLASSVVGDDQIHIQTYETPVSPGIYDLFIREAPLSIGIVWDTSGSVSSFRASIVNAVRSVARYAKPDDLILNLFPFGEPVAKALMPEWSGDPVEIFTNLQHYPWQDSSSNVEGGLLTSVKSLSEQRGTKAIILLTDGESSGSKLNEQTWKAINLVKPRIFVTAIPTGQNAARARQLDNYLQSYAYAYNGDYIPMGDQSDFEKTFDTIRTKLDTPKSYNVQFQLEENLPPPGAIKIEKPEMLDDIGLTQDLMIIMDASGSMLQHINGQRRIDVAKNAVSAVLSKLPDTVNVGLRTFGESSADLCETRLVQPLEKLNSKNISKVIKDITPVNGAKTPIAAALLKTKDDFSAQKNDDQQIEKLVLLITDGEETCEGDPIAAVKQLKKTGLDVTINIVGFAVDDNAVQEKLKALAETDQGMYFDAADTSAIQKALEQAILPAFEVKNANGETVAQAILGGEADEIAPGFYTVVLHTQPAQYFHDVQVQSGQTVTIKTNNKK